MKLRKLTKSVIALSMSASMLASSGLAVMAVETVPAAAAQAEDYSITYGENLALGKNAVASSEEADSVAAIKVTDGVKGKGHHWGSNTTGGPDWVYVDLGDVTGIDKISVFWESQKANSYKIQYATENPDSESSWTDLRNSDTWPESRDEHLILPETVQARYVRVYIPSYSADDHGDNGIAHWNSIGIYEIEIYAKQEKEATNIALNCSGSQSSFEEGTSFTADKAFDGDTTGRTSRWASTDHGQTAVNAGPEWVYCDLGNESTIKSVKIFWENKKANSYKIQIAQDGANLEDEASWKTVKAIDTYPANLEDLIEFDQNENGRYVRLYIDSFNAVSHDPSEVQWGTVSIYEMEINGWRKGDIDPSANQTLDSMLEACTVAAPAAGSKQLSVHVPADSANGISAKFNGADLEQIIDSELNIHTPLVTKTVKVNFKATDANGNVKFKEVSVTVPGLYDVGVNDNTAPVILPEVQEWKGEEGVFTIAADAKVIYTDAAFKDAAEAMAEDYKEITGKEMSVVSGAETDARAGDIVLKLGDADGAKALGKEGYYAEIGDSIVVEAAEATGAYWSTRTLLQALKTDEGMDNINKGKMRDYPTYEIRGFMLDVGRKTFTLDYLKQMAKEMAWYKINDLQIHLNDNYIFLENYSGTGRDPMTAYSGFRLESDVKEGGNDGLNKADLTSKDVFYTKDEFRDFIQESRKLGVNIVPEIDTPAHSLAFTKVRPDLRQGTNGRQNDHFNLTTKYDESMAFIKGVFGEYMTEENPVWDLDTIVHIGADEYEASSVAYRKYVNEMLDWVKSTGRQPRVWGSFSQLSQGDPIHAEGVQINLWNYSWAHMMDMYKEGFDLININDGQYYIVPNGGYYYDYLNEGVLYNSPVNTISSDTVPAGDPQMKGGAFAVWNDMIDEKDNGISEYDVYDRLSKALPLLSAKLWGKGSLDLNGAKAVMAQLGDAPGTNFGYEVESETDAIVHLPMDDEADKSGNGYDLSSLTNAAIEEVDGKKALHLNGGNSSASTPLTTIGLDNSLRVKVKRMDGAADKDQILFESPYGSIKAVQASTGKVGITRENRDFSFDYTLPVGDWVELEIKNTFESVCLYVNGELVDVIGDDETVNGRPVKATCMFPIEKIGSETDAFNGYVDDVRIGADKAFNRTNFNSTMNLDYLVSTVISANVMDSVDGLAAAVDEAKAIISKYDPSAEEIAASTAKVGDLLKKADYEMADYTKVDAYRSLARDLSAFTPSSAAAVTRVLNSIRDGLPAASQETVDSYVASLEAALDGLVKKETNVINYVDVDTLSATDSSHQDAGSAANKVLDGDLSTMWHSQWSITTGEHWIQLEMEEPTVIRALEYTARSGGGNGTPNTYRIEVSSDGTNFTTAKGSTNVSISNQTPQMFEFDNPVECKYVRLVIERGKNNNGSAAEIRLVQPDKEADLTLLNAAIADAKARENLGWSDSTWNAFQAKIADAEALASSDNPTAYDVDVMIKDLSKALSGLRFEAETPELNFEELIALMTQAGALNEDDYTPESWAAVDAALDEAANIMDAETQAEIDAVASRLSAALDNLVEKQPEVETFTVTVDWDAEGVEPSVYTVNKGEALNIADIPAKEGYKFIGFKNGDADYDLSTPVNADLNLKAVWEKLDPEVEYVNVVIDWDIENLGTTTVVTKKGDALSVSHIPAKEGYTFKGFRNGDADYDMSAPVTENLNLKAVWEKDEPSIEMFAVTIDWDADGAEPSVISVAKGEALTLPAVPAKEGYTFKGLKNGDADYDMSAPVTGNLNLKAVWKKDAASVDTKALEAKLADAKAAHDKLPEAYKADFAKLIKAGEDVLADKDATQDDVNKAHSALNAHPYDLVLKLAGKHEEAKKADQSKYEDEDWANLDNARTRAQYLLENPSMDAAELVAAHDSLDAALKKTKTDTPVTPDKVEKSDLEAAVKEADSLKASDYTEATWKAYAAAVEKGKAVLADEKADQKAVDEALAAINSAKKALKTAGTKTPGGSTGTDKKPSGSDKKANTGVSGGLWAMTMAGAAAVATLLKKRKK